MILVSLKKANGIKGMKTQATEWEKVFAKHIIWQMIFSKTLAIRKQKTQRTTEQKIWKIPHNRSTDGK